MTWSSPVYMPVITPKSTQSKDAVTNGFDVFQVIFLLQKACFNCSLLNVQMCYQQQTIGGKSRNGESLFVAYAKNSNLRPKATYQLQQNTHVSF
jgi:hypothetical protein